jgi:hypothetical protein
MKEPKEYTRERPEAMDDNHCGFSAGIAGNQKEWAVWMCDDDTIAEGLRRRRRPVIADDHASRWLPVWIARDPSIESAA